MVGGGQGIAWPDTVICTAGGLTAANLRLQARHAELTSQALSVLQHMAQDRQLGQECQEKCCACGGTCKPSQQKKSVICSIL